jgi:AcrR family transcriptional regulator
MAATSAARRSRAPRGEGERLRDDILAATERLLLETGDEEAVSIRAIAKAVGVTPPSIYLHFADKDDLIHAVCHMTFARLGEQMEAEVAGVEDPVEAIRRRGRAYIAYGVEHPEHYRILFMSRHQHTREEFQDRSMPGMETFKALYDDVEAGMDDGLFARRDPFVVATGLWAMVHGLTSLRISSAGFPGIDDEALTEEYLDMAIRGLAAN